jgi:hypothetical protein
VILAHNEWKFGHRRGVGRTISLLLSTSWALVEEEEEEEEEKESTVFCFGVSAKSGSNKRKKKENGPLLFTCVFSYTDVCMTMGNKKRELSYQTSLLIAKNRTL